MTIGRETTDRRPDRLMSLMTGDEKHAAAATSTLDVLRVLYERVLDVAPETDRRPGARPVLLSKGHGPMAYYAVLVDRGFFPEEWLAGWASYDSPLGHHPDRNLVPGVEISSRLARARAAARRRVRRSACGRRASAPASSCWSATPSSTRAATTRRSSSPAALGLDAPDRGRRRQRSSTSYAVPGPDRASGSPPRAGTPSTVDGRDHDALEKALSSADVRTARTSSSPSVEEKRMSDPERGSSSPAPPPTWSTRTSSVALVLRRDLRPVLRRRRARGTPTGWSTSASASSCWSTSAPGWR